MNLSHYPTFALLLSAFFWACFPVLIAFSALDGGQAYFEFSILLNVTGSFLCCILIIPLFSEAIKSKLKFFISGHGGWLVVIDGGAIALSNAFAFWAISVGNSISVSFILESWPIFVFIVLAVFFKKYQGLSVGNLLIAILGVIGFYFMQFEETQKFILSEANPLIFAILAAFLQVVAVVANQRNLARLERKVSFKDVLPLQLLRMVAACVVSIAIVYILDVTEVRKITFIDWNSSNFFIGTVLAGVFVTVSALLYALGLANAHSPIVNLIWFLTPAITALLLYVFDYAPINQEIVVGALYVLSALMLVKRREESPAPFFTMVMAVLIFGTAVVYTSGQSFSEYFDYIQLTGTIYGILQAFVLSRLWQRRLDLAGYENAVRQKKRFYERKQISFEDRFVVESAIARADNIRKEAKTFSELLILSFLGVANIFILIVGRLDTFLGNSVCFLLSIAIAYLLAMSWTLNFELIKSRTTNSALTDNDLADAVLSYAFLIIAVCTFLTLFYAY